MGQSEIAQDKRRIRMITCAPFGDDGSHFRVDTPGSVYHRADLIEVYDDHGIGDFVPWVRVIRDGEIVMRIAAHNCEIMYYLPEEPTP